jgi:hypothetical protein
MSFLILSDNDDGHIPFVSRYLNEEPVIIGSEAIVGGEELTYYPAKDQITFRGDLLAPSAVWCRKPYWALEQLPVDDMFKSYSSQAIRWHINALSMCLPNSPFWLSNYWSVRKAEHKPYQLIIAKKIGFNIPEAIFTSSEQLSRNFMNNQDTIIKSHSSSQPVNKKTKEGLAIWARKVEKGKAVPLKGLNFAPAIFQQAISQKADIRVTVVGDKVFAASMATKNVSKEYDMIRDSRIGALSGETIIEPYALPDAISEKCVLLVKKLGLEFGAIDLIVDEKDTYWFLEINPNGQWAFVEVETAQPIGKAIAELLMKNMQ